MNFKNELKKAVHEIKTNHDKIIDDWCKAYMAQRYKEGKSIDVGSFTLCQQNLSWAQNEVGFKYWLEDGKPDYPIHKEWISVKDKIPSDDRRVLGTDGKKHEIVCCINSDCEWVGATSDYGYLMSLDEVTHWMPLPKPPNE